MKILLAFILMILSYSARSQILIGYTELEIMSQLKPSDQARKINTVDGGTALYVTSTVTKHYNRTYYLAKETNACYMYMLEPLDTKAMNTFVEYCNDNFVKLGSRSWQTFVNNYNVKVDLVFVERLNKNLFYFKVDY